MMAGYRSARVSWYMGIGSAACIPRFARQSMKLNSTLPLVLLLVAGGCGNSTKPGGSEGAEIEKSVRPVTEADRERISSHVSTVVAMLRARYGDVKLANNEDDLRLLQRLQDDGALQAAQKNEVSCVGTVFGEVLASR